VVCRCGRRYSLARAGELGAIPSARFEKAMAYARAEGIDLASAYSVLLGLMKREAVGQIEGPPAGVEFPYDAAFHPAVVEGLLTMRQAVERGDRVAYASRISQRHDLPMRLAFHVADNRMSLRDALQEAAQLREAPDVRILLGGAVRRRGLQPLLWVLLAASTVLLVRVWPATMSLAPRQVDHVQVGRAEVLIDGKNRVVQVLGPDPVSVLTAYCQKSGSTGGPLEALDVLPSPLNPARERVGLLRDPARPDETQMIAILADQRAGRWTAGDGRTPLEPTPAAAPAQAAWQGR
jgi:hypothetical protein